MSKRTVLAFCALAAIAGAQTFSNSVTGTFVDISTTGGTAIIGVSDDSGHSITTTVGNTLFPAGNVRVGNNGAIVGGSTTATPGFGNVAVPATGVPITGGNVNLLPFWDDLYPFPTPSNITIYWQEAGGVLTIMWKDDCSFGNAGAGLGITFEVQVFNSPASCTSPFIQYLYNDTTFSAAYAANDGASATIGYASTITGLTNAQYSFNTASVTAGTVLSILYQPYTFVITSPAGPGSVQIDMADCSGATPYYFIPYTFAAGAYPNGWLFGLDISIPNAINIWNAGYPFVGNLPQTIGPVTGLPSGLQFWMVDIGLNASFTPNGKSVKQTYIIP